MIRALQKQVYEQLNNDHSVEFFEMGEFTENNLGRSCFPDAVHPNDEGYIKIALRLAEYITALLSLDKNL